MSDGLVIRLEKRIADAERKVQLTYLLWSHEHMAYWNRDARGYTTDPAKAGRFTESAAVDTCLRAAEAGIVDRAVCMIVAPEHYRREQAA